MKTRSNLLQHGVNQIFLQPARRAPSDINCRDMIIPKQISVITDFLQQGMHISDLCIAVCRKGQEITVITLFHAKRDMNI